MPKPIVLMHIPEDRSWDDGANKMMRQMNGWDETAIPREEIAEYLWLVFHKPDITAPEIQVFHPNNFTEVQYDELKSLVLEHIKSMQQPAP